MAREATEQLRAAELAWVLLALISVGIRLRRLGWCTGELESNELMVTADGIRRLTTSSPLRQLQRVWRQQRHARRGHDESCVVVGVPRSVFARLIRAWGHTMTVPFTTELVDEVFAELREFELGPQAHSGDSLLDTVEYLIGRRVTPKAPEAGVPSPKSSGAMLTPE